MDEATTKPWEMKVDDLAAQGQRMKLDGGASINNADYRLAEDLTDANLVEAIDRLEARGRVLEDALARTNEAARVFREAMRGRLRGGRAKVIAGRAHFLADNGSYRCIRVEDAS